MDIERIQVIVESVLIAWSRQKRLDRAAQIYCQVIDARKNMIGGMDSSAEFFTKQFQHIFEP